MRLSLALVLAVSACSTTPPSVQTPPPALGLELSVSALVPGEDVTITIDGLMPNERVFLGRGAGLGAGPCPGIAGGACLDIASPVALLSRPTADVQGHVEVVVSLPANVPLGQVVGLQALAVRGPGGVDSVWSNAVERTTTDSVRTLDTLEPGELFVSEFLADPTAVTDANGEWFELHNTTGDALDLQGLRVEDNGGSGFTVETPLMVPADGFVVLAAELDPALNGGVHADATWPSFNLANGADEIVLSHNGVEIDRVAWDAGFPLAAGASTQLEPGATQWCLSEVSFGDGDLGSPGADNAPCPIPPNQAPLPELVCPASGGFNETLAFDASGSSDVDGSVVDYRFDFGDGTVVEGGDAAAMHGFTEPGTQTVTLTVTDDAGEEASTSCDVDISPELTSVTIERYLGIGDARSSSPESFTVTDLPPAVSDVTIRWTGAACRWGSSGSGYTQVEFDGTDGTTIPLGNASSISSCADHEGDEVLTPAMFNLARDASGSVMGSAWGHGSCPAGIGCRTFNESFVSWLYIDTMVYAPTPRLSCPSGLVAGDTGTIDASASEVGYGAVMAYTISVDGIVWADGPAAVTTYPFAAAGDYAIDLTVLDQFGLQATTSCVVQVN